MTNKTFEPLKNKVWYKCTGYLSGGLPAFDKEDVASAVLWLYDELVKLDYTTDTERERMALRSQVLAKLIIAFDDVRNELYDVISTQQEEGKKKE